MISKKKNTIPINEKNISFISNTSSVLIVGGNGEGTGVFGCFDILLAVDDRRLLARLLLSFLC